MQSRHFFSFKTAVSSFERRMSASSCITEDCLNYIEISRCTLLLSSSLVSRSRICLFKATILSACLLIWSSKYLEFEAALYSWLSFCSQLLLYSYSRSFSSESLAIGSPTWKGDSSYTTMSAKVGKSISDELPSSLNSWT